MKLFWNYEENSETPLNILRKIVKNNRIQIIVLPKYINEEIGISKIITFEELEKINTNNFESVIFEFQPSCIFKINYRIINNNLEDIFFNPISEHRFSYCSSELTEEEYLKIVKFFKNERMTLNRVTQECMKELITAAIILKFNLKVPKKSGEKIKINFLKNIRFINEIKNILKFENDKYLDNMEKKLTDICLSNPKDINKVVSNFMEDFYIFDENSKIRNIIINLINNFKNLENEDRKKEIEKIVWNIWIINEKEIIPFLCSEEEKFTEENIYNKLKKYSSYTIQKNNILFNNIENFNFFEKQFTYENIKIFLENLDYKLMINYLKLFLFCCRPNEFISEKQISENFSTYSSLKKYIKSIETNEIISNEITELLFHAKIKNLLLIFEEKILSFSKEDILNLKNQDLIDLRRKSYFDILDEYIKNELILLDNLKLIYKELYTLNDSRTTRIIKKLNKYENDLDFELYEFLRKKSKEIEENKQNSNFSRKDVNKKNTISYSYLNAIKEFSFSNLKRIEIYYRLILLNILFNINKEDLEKYMKEKGYESENYSNYFNSLMKNKKNLGEEHLEYILSYLKKVNKEEHDKLIFCINYLHIYSKNLLTNILDTSSYEKYFPFYKIVILEEIKLK